MRPVSLRVEGFTSFRMPVEIDFRSFDLFAITGPTGAGKTSLLDAIVFALYGKTPRLGGDYKSLLSQGAARMSVCLEFQARGTAYKVLRSMRKGGGLQVRLEEDYRGTWEPLADSVRALDGRVEKIVGLDFDGFTRAVILPQGAFDQFLRGDARKRRDILVELLQLEVYGKMAKAANSRARSAEERAATQESFLNNHFAHATQENLDGLRQSMLRRQSDSERLNEKLASIEKALESARDLQQQRETCREASTQADEAMRTAIEAGERSQAIEQDLAAVRTHLAAVGERLRVNSFREERYLELIRLEPQVKRAGELAASIGVRQKALQRATAELDALRHSFEPAQQRLASEHALLEAASKSLADAERSYEDALKESGSPDALEQLAAQLDRLPEREAALRSLDEQTAEVARSAESGRVALRKLSKQADQSAARVLELELHLEHVRQEHAAADLRGALRKGEACPVCEQRVTKLPPALNQQSMDDAKSQLEQARKEMQEARQRLAELAARVESCGPQIELLQQTREGLARAVEELRSRGSAVELRSRAHAIRNQDQLCRKMRSDVDQARARLAEAQSAAGAIETKLAVLAESRVGLEGQLTQYRSEMAALEDRLANWSEREFAAQKRAKSERETLVKEDEDVRARIHTLELEQAAARQFREVAAEKEKLYRLTAQTAQARIADLVRRVRRIISIPENANEWEFLERQHTALRDQRQNLDQELGALATEIVKMDESVLKAAELRAQIAECRRQHELYKDIGGTLRGDRFIEFLLGQAMNNLAAEGSKYLRRLSTDRYSFAAVESSFSVVDRWNADELRPVATLSGGESFVASLALALALSSTITQLSADRGRITLDSLFLDEGFSTLDPETLDMVVGAIESLAGGDRLVGVVSHMPELALRLPAQVHVHKAVGGSTVEITSPAA